MAVFGVLEVEPIVQVNDKTRISASKSYKTKDAPAITSVRIRASASDDWVIVDGGATTELDWFIDWQYTAAGTYVAEVEIVAVDTYTFTAPITVVTPAQDCLLSSDADLVGHEPSIMRWVPDGRNSFLNVHRTSQKQILDWLDSIRVWRDDGTKLTKEDLKLTDDLKLLSTYLTLKNIFGGLSNKPDDVFYQKADDYDKLARSVMARGRIQADYNGNETLDKGEEADIKSGLLVRR